MAKRGSNEYAAYLFTFKAKKWIGFDDFLSRWYADPSTTEEWSSGQSKSIPSDAPVFVMKQGESPTGIIASGFTDSPNRPYRHARRGEVGSGRANVLRFTQFLRPDLDELLDISDLPREYWAARGSGVGLPPEIYTTIKTRWDSLIVRNAERNSKAQVPPTLGTEDAAPEYKIGTEDSRTVALREIKERRGQQAFRQKLIDIYRGRCAVSGCTVRDVLEAAHIKPYLGQNEDNPQNGLLLRADLHTLFDLSLLGIHPVSKTVHLHPSLRGSEYASFERGALKLGKNLPSFEALQFRWREFRKRLG